MTRKRKILKRKGKRKPNHLRKSPLLTLTQKKKVKKRKDDRNPSLRPPLVVPLHQKRLALYALEEFILLLLKPKA